MGPELKSRVDAAVFSVAAGVDVAISAWVAEAGNRVSGQESSEEEGKLREGPARDATVKELDA